MNDSLHLKKNREIQFSESVPIKGITVIHLLLQEKATNLQILNIWIIGTRLMTVDRNG